MSKRDDVTPPTIPDRAITLKADFTGKVILDEDQLIRCLTKLRAYVKAVSDSNLSCLRAEIDLQVSTVKRDVETSIREACTNLESNLLQKHGTHEDRLQGLDDEFAALKIQFKKLENIQQAEPAVAKVPSPPPGPEGDEASPSSPRERTAAFSDDEDRPFTPEKLGKMSRSKTLTLGPGGSLMRAERSRPESRSEVDAEDDDIVSELRPTEETEMVPASSVPRASFVTGMANQLEQNAAMAQVLKEQSDKALAEVKLEIQQSANLAKRLEHKLEIEVAALTTRLQNAEERNRVQSKKAIADEEKHKQALDTINRLHANVQGVSQKSTELKDDFEATKTKMASDFKTAFSATQAEVADLRDVVSQAALKSEFEPKLDGALFNLNRLNKNVQRAEEHVEQHDNQINEMASEVGECTHKLTLTVTRKEVDRRFDGIEHQMGGLGQVLSEARESLGDLSAAILALSSKAERADLNVLREEVCSISESFKDREQAVLFGARCLSCNRVFDDVSKDHNAVDLFGEKQRSNLFTQVQKALHSPKIDPLAKIKVLAVKVGRPMTVPGGGGSGNFEGRDDSSFACGVDDVQLVPVRESAGKMDTPRTEGMPKIGKGRRAKGAPQRDVLGARGVREGPMDFVHPLSQLVGGANLR